MNISALSDARFAEEVKLGTVLCAFDRAVQVDLQVPDNETTQELAVLLLVDIHPS